jgi:hypothetical protein
LKIALTVEEEIGCPGSRDIVTSHAGNRPILSRPLRPHFRNRRPTRGMTGENWPGGSGNTKIFAEFGIPAVN